MSKSKSNSDYSGQRRERKSSRAQPYVRIDTPSAAVRAIGRLQTKIDDTTDAIYRQQEKLAGYNERMVLLKGHYEDLNTFALNRAAARARGDGKALPPVVRYLQPDISNLRMFDLPAMAPLPNLFMAPPGASAKPVEIKAAVDSDAAAAADAADVAAAASIIDISGDTASEGETTDSEFEAVYPLKSKKRSSKGKGKTKLPRSARVMKVKPEVKQEQNAAAAVAAEPEEDICPVCYEELQPGKCDVFPTCLRHMFCFDCLPKLNIDVGCPCCRKSVVIG